MDEPVSLELERLPRQTLHHAWAPKLGRLIVLSSVGQLWLWAMLEAHLSAKLNRALSGAVFLMGERRS